MKKSTLTDETRLVTDLGANSVDIVELEMAIEDAFEIDVPANEAECVDPTVGGYIRWVQVQVEES